MMTNGTKESKTVAETLRKPIEELQSLLVQ